MFRWAVWGYVDHLMEYVLLWLQAQAEAQKAAVCFQRANSVYQVAKEMVQLAEERNFPEDGDRRQIDAAWQEMLNHATIKVKSDRRGLAGDAKPRHYQGKDRSTRPGRRC